MHFSASYHDPVHYTGGTVPPVLSFLFSPCFLSGEKCEEAEIVCLLIGITDALSLRKASVEMLLISAGDFFQIVIAQGNATQHFFSSSFVIFSIFVFPRFRAFSSSFVFIRVYSFQIFDFIS